MLDTKNPDVVEFNSKRICVSIYAVWAHFAPVFRYKMRTLLRNYRNGLREEKHGETSRAEAPIRPDEDR